MFLPNHLLLKKVRDLKFHSVCLSFSYIFFLGCFYKKSDDLYGLKAQIRSSLNN